MSNELGVLVHTDLASIKTEAQDLIGSALATPPTANPDQASLGSSFAATMKDAIHGIDGQDRAAAEKMAAVDNGTSDDLVGAMLSSQQASLSFSMLMQVRNKVMGAVDDLLKLPI
jgi:flagellar hook-basal body complex protein FliE